MMKRWILIGVILGGMLSVLAWPVSGSGLITWAQAAACSATPSNQTTAADVTSYISQCLTVSDAVKSALSTATQAAIQQGRLSAEAMLDMLKKLESSQATQSQKEQILTIITNTLSAAIPAQLLINEITEGISLRAPFEAIVLNVQNQAQTLTATKALMDAKGIVVPKYSQSHTDTAITEIAKAIEDYIANSNNPNSDVRNAQAVQAFVLTRLNNLVGTSLSQQIVSDIQSHVSGEEFSAIALSACVRWEKCST